MTAAKPKPSSFVWEFDGNMFRMGVKVRAFSFSGEMEKKSVIIELNVKPSSWLTVFEGNMEMIGVGCCRISEPLEEDGFVEVNAVSIEDVSSGFDELDNDDIRFVSVYW